jgi:hypothetical protein
MGRDSEHIIHIRDLSQETFSPLAAGLFASRKVAREERLRALGVLPKINIRSQENAMHAIKALAVATILVFGFTSLAFARSGGGGGGGGGGGSGGSGASGGSAGGTSGGASSSSGPASGATGSVSTPGGNARTTGSGARNGPNNTLNSGDPNGPYKAYRPTNSLGVPSSPYGQ